MTKPLLSGSSVCCFLRQATHSSGPDGAPAGAPGSATNPVLTTHAGKPETSDSGVGAGSSATDLSAHFLSAIQAFKGAVDSDKKMSPARRFSGYHKSADSRRNFGVSSENSSMSNGDLARYIRSYFERKDKSRLYYDFLTLPDADLLDLVTFNVISDFSVIPSTTGFTLSKLFQTETRTTMKVFEVFNKMDLFLSFICDIYGNHFKYLDSISKLIRESVLPFMPRVVIHVWTLLLESLFVPTPHASSEALSSALDDHALLWDCCHPLTSHFHAQCTVYTMRYTTATLAALETQQLSNKDKKDPTPVKTIPSSVPSSVPPLQSPGKGPRDYSSLQGFCRAYLRDGVCPRISTQKLCQAKAPSGVTPAFINLKHNAEFTKLTPIAKTTIRNAFQALEGVPCKV